MASAKIIFDTRSKRRSEKYPVTIQINHRSETAYIHTGYLCATDEWDTENGRVTKSKNYPDHKEATIAINDVLAKANKYILKNTERLHLLSCKRLRDEIENYNQEKEIKKQESHITLQQGINEYISYLRNHNIPEHEQRKRTDKYVKEVERILKVLTNCLGTDILVNSVNDFHVAKYFNIIINKTSKKNSDKIKAPTYNSYIVQARYLFTYLIKKGHDCKNPFLSIQLKKSTTIPKMLQLKEFYELLQKIETGNRIRPLNYITRKDNIERYEGKNMYRTWLSNAIKIALYGGGRRREEIMMLQWSSISVNEETKDLQGGFLHYRDFKGERLKNITLQDEQLIISIPITKELADLLILMGWKNKKNSDEYIIEPSSAGRTHLMQCLTKGFGHFYEQISNPRPGISFKSIRKTYITYINTLIGGHTKDITGHHSDKVIAKHYLDPSLINQKVANELNFNAPAK